MVNVLSIIVCAIISMAIGGFWYSPGVFGNVWMKLAGLNKNDMEAAKKKGMAWNYIIQFIGALVMAAIFGSIIMMAGATTPMGGIAVGIMVWLGFIATVTVGSVLWERRNWAYFVLTNLHYLVVLIVTGIILAVW
jgi:membrane protein YdbS with pleckstrin-like domain